MTSQPKAILVDSVPKLHECLRDLDSVQVPLAVDLEGNELGRIGTLSTLQIYPEGGEKVYVIDVTTLGTSAFTTTVDGLPSLGKIMKGSRRKIIFDVRSDANALYFHHEIKLAGVYDLQLLELASRASQCLRTRLVCGLTKTISNSGLRLGAEWDKVKTAGHRLFAPEKGGDLALWHKRPLQPELVEYAAQDVVVLFQLEEALAKQIRGGRALWDARILKETSKRVGASQTTAWQVKSRDNALAPASGWGK